MTQRRECRALHSYYVAVDTTALTSFRGLIPLYNLVLKFKLFCTSFTVLDTCSVYVSHTCTSNRGYSLKESLCSRTVQPVVGTAQLVQSILELMHSIAQLMQSTSMDGTWRGTLILGTVRSACGSAQLINGIAQLIVGIRPARTFCMRHCTADTC